MTKAEKNKVISDPSSSAHFWEALTDHTQAAVQLAMQWLAYVYPGSELQIDRTLNNALPHSDNDLSSRWAQFLDENDVEEHVEALTWMADVIPNEQIPFLVETCWRLVLVDHELPTHVPLALRILGQIIDIKEQKIHEIGGDVFRELTESDENKSRAPLLPVDPRYLDRIEWRLYGHTATSRNLFVPKNTKKKVKTGRLSGFVYGFIVGAATLAFLVFGPLQIGRISVSRLQHNNIPDTALTPAPEITAIEIDSPNEPVAEQEELTPVLVEAPETVEVELPVVEPVVAEPVPEQVAEVVTTVVEANDTAQRVLMTVSANVLNVRNQPSVESVVLAKLGKGAKVWAYPDEATGLWMKIAFDDKIGYASARFMVAAE